MITYLDGTPAPSQPGLAALQNAVDQASRSRPSRVTIDGAVTAGAPEPALEQRRIEAVFAAFAKAGIDARSIRVELRPSSPQGYAERQDGLIVQLTYGELPQP